MGPLKVVPKARAIAGWLTFTLEVSSLAMKMPTATMAKSSHLFGWAPNEPLRKPDLLFLLQHHPDIPLQFLHLSLRRCIQRMMPTEAEAREMVLESVLNVLMWSCLIEIQRWPTHATVLHTAPSDRDTGCRSVYRSEEHTSELQSQSNL